MNSYKATTYEQMEKPKKEKKFKQNVYEDKGKLIEDNEGHDIVKAVKGKKKTIKNILIDLTYLIKYEVNVYLIKLSMLVYTEKMVDSFSPEDILIDNLSFKLNKGSSYIVDRRAVTFWPSGSNIYKPTIGNRVLKLSSNGEDNSWLDPQSVRIFFTLQNLNTGTCNNKLRHLSPPSCFFFLRSMRIIAGNQVVEDFNDYNQVHHMFSKMMSQGARKHEANEGFGYRYDEELKKR